MPDARRLLAGASRVSRRVHRRLQQHAGAGREQRQYGNEPEKRSVPLAEKPRQQQTDGGQGRNDEQGIVGLSEKGPGNVPTAGARKTFWKSPYTVVVRRADHVGEENTEVVGVHVRGHRRESLVLQVARGPRRNVAKMDGAEHVQHE